MVDRLRHKQEDVGSSPTPAPNLDVVHDWMEFSFRISMGESPWSATYRTTRWSIMLFQQMCPERSMDWDQWWGS